MPADTPSTIQVGSVIGRTFDSLGREWSLFLVLAAPAGLGSVLQSLILGPPAATAPGSAGPLNLGDVVPYVGATVLSALFALLSSVAITVAADALWQGRPIGVGAAFAGGFRAIPRYLGVWIVLGFVLGGLAVIVVAVIALVAAVSGPGAVAVGAIVAFVAIPALVYLSARLALMGPVIVLERQGVLGSMVRAWDLSRNHALVLFLLSLAIGICAGLPLWGGSLFAGFVDDPLIAGIALGIATLVFEPLPAIAMVLAWGDRIGGRHADSEIMARGRGRAVGAVLVLGLGAILFVAGFGVAAQATSSLTSLR
jgi:hypothetical protein